MPKLTKYFFCGLTDSKGSVVDAGRKLFGKKKNRKELSLGSEITLTKNQIKDIIKVIRSLENGGSFLKETTNKINCQKGGFLNFLRPLMTAGLPLTKNVLTTLAKSILVLLGLTAVASATDAAIQKKIF